MADQKITELDEIVTIDPANDVVAIVDDSLLQTMKVKVSDLVAAGGGSIGKIITVAKSGGDYSDIDTALGDAEVLSASVSDPIGILVYPGIYTEPGITVPPYVCLVGVDAHCVIIEPDFVTNDMVTLSEASKIEGFTIRNATSGVGVLVDNALTPKAEARNITIGNCSIGVQLDSGTEFLLTDSNIKTDNTISVQTNNSADEIVSVGNALVYEDIDIISGAQLLGVYFSEADEDRFMVQNEISVGTYLLGREACFGKGDNHIIGMEVKTNTNQEIGTWNTITDQMKSSSGSTASLLPGTGADNALYIGGDTVFPGIKADITTAIALGAGAIVWEYWSGASWDAFNVLAADDAAPLDQYGSDTFGRTAFEHIRFDEAIESGWATKSLDGETKFWVRMRVTSTITTIPVAEKIKVHTDHAEINPDGSLQFFGKARLSRRLGVDYFFDSAGLSATNKDVLLSSNVDIAIINNSFANTAYDGLAFILKIPPGLDTSQPLTIEVRWASEGTDTGDVELLNFAAGFKVGDVLDGTLSESSESDIISIANQPDEVQLTTFNPEVADFAPGESLGIFIGRDSTGGNLNDTLGDDVYIISIHVTGVFWR